MNSVACDYNFSSWAGGEPHLGAQKPVGSHDVLTVFFPVPWEAMVPQEMITAAPLLRVLRAFSEPLYSPAADMSFLIQLS